MVLEEKEKELEKKTESDLVEKELNDDDVAFKTQTTTMCAIENRNECR